jgi:hypothetical protein
VYYLVIAFAQTINIQNVVEDLVLVLMWSPVLCALVYCAWPHKRVDPGDYTKVPISVVASREETLVDSEDVTLQVEVNFTDCLPNMDSDSGGAVHTVYDQEDDTVCSCLALEGAGLGLGEP